MEPWQGVRDGASPLAACGQAEGSVPARCLRWHQSCTKVYFWYILLLYRPALTFSTIKALKLVLGPAPGTGAPVGPDVSLRFAPRCGGHGSALIGARQGPAGAGGTGGVAPTTAPPLASGKFQCWAGRMRPWWCRCHGSAMGLPHGPGHRGWGRGGCVRLCPTHVL